MLFDNNEKKWLGLKCNPVWQYISKEPLTRPKYEKQKFLLRRIKDFSPFLWNKQTKKYVQPRHASPCLVHQKGRRVSLPWTGSGKLRHRSTAALLPLPCSPISVPLYPQENLITGMRSLSDGNWLLTYAVLNAHHASSNLTDLSLDEEKEEVSS